MLMSLMALLYNHFYKIIWVFLGSLHTWTGNCSAGYHCISGSWTPAPTDGISGRVCPEGTYCPEGIPTPVKCPAGTFNNFTGLKTEGECTRCAPGMYCLNDGLVYPTGLCDERYFCELGAIYAKPLDTSTGGNCSVGHYCPVGTKLPLPCQVTYNVLCVRYQPNKSYYSTKIFTI